MLETLALPAASNEQTLLAPELLVSVGVGDQIMLTARGRSSVEESQIQIYHGVDIVFMGWAFIRGDANSDGFFDISDPITLLDILFLAGGTDCESSLDANDDGQVDVADVIAMLGAIFEPNSALQMPFPGCGIDPTLSPLSCLGGSCP